MFLKRDIGENVLPLEEWAIATAKCSTHTRGTLSAGGAQGMVKGRTESGWAQSISSEGNKCQPLFLILT